MTGLPGARLPSALQAAHRRLAVWLVLLALGSLAFGFALVPLYDHLCRVAGLNGKTFETGGLNAAGGGSESAAQGGLVDVARTVTVEFTATVMPELPWDIRPLDTSIDVHPGQSHSTRFLVHNRSGETLVGQAVPSVSPGQAAAHFHKIQCFCFSQQVLAPGEARELPLTFVVRPDLDANVRTITLAYAFFKVTPNPTRTP